MDNVDRMEDTSSNNHYSKSPSWDGWSSVVKYFGLELQSPYAQYLLDGTKSIETRGYPIPDALLSKRIEVLESSKGVDGVSSIPDRVALMAPLTSTENANDDGASSSRVLHRRGWCTFSHCFRYATAIEFEADSHKHLVDVSSRYGWDETKPMYGWIVGSCGLHDGENNTSDDCVQYFAERRMRSIFEIITENRRSE